MKHFALAAAVVASIGASMAGTTTARSEVYLERTSPSRFVACYERRYVQAVVRVDTRGTRVRSPNVSWEIQGDSWRQVRNLGVYIERRTTVEPDHFTLRRVSC